MTDLGSCNRPGSVFSEKIVVQFPRVSRRAARRVGVPGHVDKGEEEFMVSWPSPNMKSFNGARHRVPSSAPVEAGRFLSYEVGLVFWKDLT
jgi:hypothetical protein